MVFSSLFGATNNKVCLYFSRLVLFLPTQTVQSHTEQRGPPGLETCVPYQCVFFCLVFSPLIVSFWTAFSHHYHSFIPIPFACIRHTVVAHTHHPRHFTGTTLLRRIISSSCIKSRMAASQPLSAAVQADLAVRGAQTFMPNQKHLFRRVICIEWSHLFALRIYFT